MEKNKIVKNPFIKNLQLINNKTLVEHSIDYAKTSNYIRKIYISTDSDEIKDMAKKNNVPVFESCEKAALYLKNLK